MQSKLADFYYISYLITRQKTCARVLLEEPERRMYLKRFRRPGLENIHRQALCKQVNTLARKVVYCPYCSATNGAVKKAGVLKIIHDKFRAKKTADEMEKWKRTFAPAVEAQKELGMYLNKAIHEDLNPLKTLDLFKRISDEVILMHDVIAYKTNVSTLRTANYSAYVPHSVVRKSISGSISPFHRFASDHLSLRMVLRTKMISPSNLRKLFSPMLS